MLSLQLIDTADILAVMEDARDAEAAAVLGTIWGSWSVSDLLMWHAKKFRERNRKLRKDGREGKRENKSEK